MKGLLVEGTRIALYTAKAQIVTYFKRTDEDFFIKLAEMLHKQQNAHYLAWYEVQWGYFSPQYIGRTYIHKG